MAAYPGYPPAGFYQYPDHPRELKKTYLALLPPEQIIEICLTLDYYVPLHFKGALWPLDLQGTIDAIKAVKEKEEREKREQEEAAQREREQRERDQQQSAPSTDPPSTDPPPEGGSESAKEPESNGADKSQEPPAQSAPQEANVSSTSTSTSTPQPQHQPQSQPQPQPQPQPQAPVPYGFPYYPYGPYPPPPGYPPADAPIPAPAPAPPPPPPPPPLTYPHPSHPLYSNSPPTAGPSRVSQGPQPLPAASSDGNGPTVGPSAGMPSYEDMIVEALLEAENAPPDENGQRPDGLAPKDVYAWMAAHYSLQSNFRPSASQALQKAYKRGRLEKGAGGKYKVNHNAGASSLPMTRRNNRRPQSSVPPPPGTIRGMHITTPSSAANSTPVFTNSNSQNLDALFTLTQALEQKGAQAHHAPADANSGDAAAYEAAQTLLKAIQERYAAENTHAQDAHQQQQQQQHAQVAVNGHGHANNASSSTGQDAMDVDMEGLDADTRAHLQAQLALLAAQLTEIAYAEQVEAADEAAATQQAHGSHQPHTIQPAPNTATTAPATQQPMFASTSQWSSQFTPTSFAAQQAPASYASTMYAPQQAAASYTTQPLAQPSIPIDPALFASAPTSQSTASQSPSTPTPQTPQPASAQPQAQATTQPEQHPQNHPPDPQHEQHPPASESHPTQSHADPTTTDPSSQADPTTTDTETADEMDMDAQMEAAMDEMSRDMEKDMGEHGKEGHGEHGDGEHGGGPQHTHAVESQGGVPQPHNEGEPHHEGDTQPQPDPNGDTQMGHDEDDEDDDSDDDDDMEEVEVPAFVHEQVQAIMGQLGVA
ncbi:uncharacterized protein SCHCODRAFT_02638722 [Schizophyllum commune H4-8]|uniref:Histone H1 n=1 Tax=Schizophyllum commune (strain H4-8 / FGSC 9210) TaxID=578458 RepID=D8QFL0_SCHCM|nr:uncharacterized protein SCHCODRAFT_02638722 [Schizophyllum commune H4-8]KAI5887686.1 hypothetical protein SCHCODRAFT_02638722 [Schizophyllum commune H4-8]